MVILIQKIDLSNNINLTHLTLDDLLIFNQEIDLSN